MLSSSKIGDKCALVLNDAGFVSWKVPEMAKWINLATRDLVLLKPTALTANVAMLLTPNATKQSLAGASFVNTADGSAATVTALQLLDVTRNLGATGTEAAAGSAVTRVERQVLDTMLPGWHALAAGTEVSRFVFDQADPLTFYVFRKAPATALYLETVVSREPVNTLDDAATELGSDDIDAGLSDIYESPLVDATLARSFAKEAENPGSMARSAAHYRAFASALGVKLQNEASYPHARRGALPAAGQGG